MAKYHSMSRINWIAAFNRLFEVINTQGETYYSGPKFIDVLKELSYAVPSYQQLIDDLNNRGKSTSRKDYYFDILMSLDEAQRLEAFQVFIKRLEVYMPDKIHALKEELKLSSNSSTQTVQPVTQASIPEDIWNAEKLVDFLEKMDKAITEKDFNRVVTLAYSCLEGLYKSFVKKNIPSKATLSDVNPLAKEVKEFIKQKLDAEKRPYPDLIIQLITTATYAISNARNSFSESHFNSDAEEWLAEYARDNVNSIARLVLKFI